MGLLTIRYFVPLSRFRYLSAIAVLRCISALVMPTFTNMDPCFTATFTRSHYFPHHFVSVVFSSQQNYNGSQRRTDLPHYGVIDIVVFVRCKFTYIVIVEELRDQLGWYCADLSTNMTFGKDVDQNILNSFFEGGKVGGHWGRHTSKKTICRQ